MGEIFFVVKAMIVTVVVIVLLQMKIGRQTLEQRGLTFIRHSTAIEALRGVADGAVVVIGQGYDWAKYSIEKKIGKTESAAEKKKTWELDTSKPTGDEIE